nr:uncharacterized protein LOC110782640 [Spinacia oleracea]
MFHSNRGGSSLKSLDLVCVTLSRELLEFLLNELTVLEQLRVRSSDDLVSLKVTESSKCLKYLDICHCPNMKELEVHAPNLLSLAFAWNHRFGNVVFGSLPSLVDVFFGEYNQRLLLRLKQIRSFSLQLTKLSLHTAMVVHKDLVIPKFDNVKQLEFRVSLRGHQNLVALRCFVEACPLLHELALEIKWDCGCAMKSTCDSVAEANDYDLTEENRCTLEHLRKFELDGPFRFSSHVDYEYSLVLYIIKNAMKLESFICNTGFSELKFHEIADSSKEQQIEAARQLAMVIPSRVNVEII